MRHDWQFATDTLGRDNNRPVLASVSEIPPRATRAIVVHANADFDLDEAIRAAHRSLSRNPRGYFLMVESDTYTDQVRHGIDRMVEFNRVIERTAAFVGRDTLLLFTADHSFDIRIRGGLRGTALLEGLEEAEAKARAETARHPDSGSAHGQRPHRRGSARGGAGPGSGARPRFHVEHGPVRRDDARLWLAGAAGKHTRAHAVRRSPVTR